MIAGIGTDLCSIARVRKAAGNDAFRKAVFTEEELAYAASRGVGRDASLAAAFAAKEAFVKALGTGFGTLRPGDIGVSHNETGAPIYRPGEKAAALMKERGVARVWLSLTHEGDLAMAAAVAEKE